VGLTFIIWYKTPTRHYQNRRTPRNRTIDQASSCRLVGSA